MATKPTISAEGLAKELSSPKLTNDQLEALWKTHAANIRPKLERPPLVVGIPYPDVLRGHVTVKPADLGKLAEGLAAHPLVKSWQVFPLGIVNPEKFHVAINLGKRL